MALIYVVPFVLYVLGTAFIARFDNAAYALAYSIVAVLVAIVTGALFARERRKILQVHPNVFWGVLFGLVGIALWIGLCELQLEQKLTSFLPAFLQPGEREAFRPFEILDSDWKLWSFLAARIIGIAVLVPIAEELFWRGFLLRWLIDPEFEKVPIGEFSASSCAIVTLMFTLAHPEWFAAASYCLLINGLLYWKKDLWLCVVCHATSNLALAIYVLTTDEWHLW